MEIITITIQNAENGRASVKMTPTFDNLIKMLDSGHVDPKMSYALAAVNAIIKMDRELDGKIKPKLIQAPPDLFR